MPTSTKRKNRGGKESSSGRESSESDEEQPTKRVNVNKKKQRIIISSDEETTDNKDDYSKSFSEDSSVSEQSDDVKDEDTDSDKYDSSDSFLVGDEDQEEGSSYDSDSEYQPPDPGMNAIAYSRDKKGSRRKRKKIKSEDRDILDLEAQEVSIHRINIRHPKLKSLQDQECQIRYIMQQYNEPNGKKDPRRNEYEKYPMKAVEMFAEDQKFFEEYEKEDFEVVIYVQKVDKYINLLKSYGLPKSEAFTRQINSIIFHYREDEIYAITTAQAWNVVQWCSDFSFPGKIAARMLSEKGKRECNTKSLVGTEYAAKKTHKQLQETNPYEILDYVTNFTTEIRENASILRLKCFAKQIENGDDGGVTDEEEDGEEDEMASASKSALKHKKSKSKVPPSPQTQKMSSKKVVHGVKVLVSQGSIRIKRRFRPRDFVAILNHLSLIFEGEDTYTIQGEKEKDSSAHIQNLQNVPQELAKKLDLELATIIHNGVANDNHLHQLMNFEFYHKHFNKFFDGVQFFLKHGTENIKVWHDHPPSVQELVKHLRRIDGLANLVSGETETTFMKRLANVKLGYNCSNDGKGFAPRPEKFLNFINGCIQSKGDNQVYWHLLNRWTYVQQPYLFLIHERFINMLKDYLVLDKEVGLEKFQWPREARDESDPELQTKKYLRQYQKYSNYFVSDEEKLDNGLIDMLKIFVENDGTETLIIYYVLAGFQHQTVNRGSHISNSIMKIRKSKTAVGGSARKSVGGSEINKKQVEELYNRVSIRKPKFKKAFRNMDSFEKALNDAKVVIIFGQWGQENGDSQRRTLYDEKELPLQITSQLILQKLDVADLLRFVKKLKGRFPNMTTSNISVELVKLLKSEGFLSQDGSMTSKLFIQTEDGFSLPALGNLDVPFYQKIISQFQPNSVPLSSKLNLIHLKQKLDEIGVKKLKLVEIENAEEEDSE